MSIASAAEAPGTPEAGERLGDVATGNVLGFGTAGASAFGSIL